MLSCHKLPILLVMIWLAVLLSSGPALAATPDQAASLHAEFSHLLETYVHDNLVDYKSWTANKKDHAALGNYVDQLTALDPAGWPTDAGLAYWINLYNAVTLRLILDNYPLESIKDLGGFLKKSPWKRELVTVAGRTLTLNNIENDIIRPEFGDPRIHFALNCASLGCPPLSPEAYSPANLGNQLDAACTLALNQDPWVLVDGRNLKLTKIFDWYRQDFEIQDGKVVDFIRRFRKKPLPEGDLKIGYLDYDWSLNEAPR